MKKTFLFLLLGLGLISQTFADYRWVIYPKSQLLSSSYDFLDEEENFICAVDKDWWNWTATYLLNTEDGYQGEARGRFFSMGSILSCMKEIDFKDSDENPLSFVAGHFFTSSRAKFSFYDYLVIVKLNSAKTSFLKVTNVKNSKVLKK